MCLLPRSVPGPVLGSADMADGHTNWVPAVTGLPVLIGKADLELSGPHENRLRVLIGRMGLLKLKSEQELLKE